MSEVYAVFQVNGWQRDMHPVEIFYDPLEARRFAEKMNVLNVQDHLNDTREWRVYRRTQTDWSRLSDVTVND